MLRLILITCLLQTGGLWADPIGLRLPDTNAVVLESLDLPVYVDSSLTGASVLAYQLQISFDAALIQVLGVSAAGYLGEPFGLPAVNLETAGQITVAAAGITPLTGSGVLLMIHFAALLPGESNVLFTGSESNFFNEGTPALTFIDGSISISPLVTTQNRQVDPESFTLHQNFPNPFNPRTAINYILSEQTAVKLSVFDIQGHEVKVLDQGIKPPGNYTVSWNGIDQHGKLENAGVYLCRFQAGNYTRTIRMIYLP